MENVKIKVHFAGGEFIEFTEVDKIIGENMLEWLNKPEENANVYVLTSSKLKLKTYLVRNLITMINITEL